MDAMLFLFFIFFILVAVVVVVVMRQLDMCVLVSFVHLNVNYCEQCMVV